MSFSFVFLLKIPNVNNLNEQAVEISGLREIPRERVLCTDTHKDPPAFETLPYSRDTLPLVAQTQKEYIHKKLGVRIERCYVITIVFKVEVEAMAHAREIFSMFINKNGKLQLSYFNLAPINRAFSFHGRIFKERPPPDVMHLVNTRKTLPYSIWCNIRSFLQGTHAQIKTNK